MYLDNRNTCIWMQQNKKIDEKERDDFTVMLISCSIKVIYTCVYIQVYRYVYNKHRYIYIYIYIFFLGLKCFYWLKHDMWLPYIFPWLIDENSYLANMANAFHSVLWSSLLVYVKQNVILTKIKHLLGLLLSTEIYWVDHSHRRLGSASPSMILIYPIYFRRQSVTNLISNNICKTCINISFYFCRVRMKTEIEEFLLNSAETT